MEIQEWFSWTNLAQILSWAGRHGLSQGCGHLRLDWKIYFLAGWHSCSVQFNSLTQLCRTRCDPMNHSTPSLPVHHQLPEFTQTHVHQVGDAIQPFHTLPSPSPPASNHSQHQGLFQWVNSSHEVAKVLEFQLQHQSLNEHPGLISFRMNWLDLLAAQGTLKSLFQHHSSKASNFQCSAYFTSNSHIDTWLLEKP